MGNNSKRHDRRPREGAVGAASSRAFPLLGGLVAFAFLELLHYPLLRLPYYWDEAGYYIPAAMDFCRSWRLVPQSTLLTEHTPLVIIYLAFAWRAFGFSTLVTRTAMLAFAAGTLACVYALGRRVANREIACWSVLLLALSPLFFAQSTLAHLDLAAGLFTLLAISAQLDDHPARFALASTAAVLSKETAVVLLPASWILGWRQRRRPTGPSLRAWWIASLAPVAALMAWAAYYHHVTGSWTGNREYLRYNLYANLNPIRVLLTLMRRLYEACVGGFTWVLTAGAMAGILSTRKSNPAVVRARPGRDPRAIERSENPAKTGIHSFFSLAGSLIALYLLMLSVVGGAVLPRYLLPIFPPLILVAAALIWRLPRPLARSIMVFTAGCFVWAWFLNPPYPFPFEDNLAYADFIHLHQQAARLLEDQADKGRILTAWPATDELIHPVLGYVSRPLEVIPLQDFTRHDFDSVSPQSFDYVYLYSRHWEPPNNLLTRHIWLQELQQSYFEYQPQIPEDELASRYHLRLLAGFERRGQWVRIYVRINP